MKWQKNQKIQDLTLTLLLKRGILTIRHYKVKEWNRFDTDIQEALVKKYDVILTDYKEPLTKGQIILSIGMAIYHNLTKKNLDKGIGLIQSGIGMLSEFGNEFGKAFDSGPRKTHSQKDVRSAFWGNESKETRKETMSFYGKKIDFW